MHLSILSLLILLPIEFGGGPVVFHFALFLFLSVQAGNVSADRILSKVLWASYESHWDLFHYTKATPTNTFLISPPSASASVETLLLRGSVRHTLNLFKYFEWPFIFFLTEQCS